MKPVRILVTGGTIDKIHDPTAETLNFATDGTTQITELLGFARCDFPTIEIILQKDSLDFEDADRDRIVAAIARSPETAIVVTHGTGTMGESARWVADRIAGRVTGKTVVFTGALRPHSLGHSDGPFNLGGAIIAAQILAEGVYGVMNGRCFPAADLHKNTELGRFDR